MYEERNGATKQILTLKEERDHSKKSKSDKKKKNKNTENNFQMKQNWNQNSLNSFPGRKRMKTYFIVTLC